VGQSSVRAFAFLRVAAMLLVLTGCQTGVGLFGAAETAENGAKTADPPETIAPPQQADRLALASPPPVRPSVTATRHDSVFAAIPSNLDSKAEMVVRARGIYAHLMAAGAPCATPTAYTALLRRTLTAPERDFFVPAVGSAAAIEVASVSLCGNAPVLMQTYVSGTPPQQTASVLMLGASTVDPVIAVEAHRDLQKTPNAARRLPIGCGDWKIIDSTRLGEVRPDGRRPERWRYAACGAVLDVTVTVPAGNEGGRVQGVAVAGG
jgi:hypothetical protein